MAGVRGGHSRLEAKSNRKHCVCVLRVDPQSQKLSISIVDDDEEVVSSPKSDRSSSEGRVQIFKYLPAEFKRLASDCDVLSNIVDGE